MKTSSFFAAQEKSLREIIQYVESQLSALPSEDLKWKPAPKSWSAIECLEHLYLSNKHYVKELEKAFNTNALAEKQAEEIKYGWLANLAIKRLRPENGEIKHKMKAPAGFDPKKIEWTATVSVEEFLKQQYVLLDFLERAKSYPLLKVKIKTTIPLVSFHLAETFAFLTAHMERHIQQAKNVRQAALQDASA